jgi:hypothetical protein
MKFRWLWGLIFLFALSGCTTPPTTTSTPTPDYAGWEGIYFGAYAAGTDMEQALGHNFAIQLYYHKWNGSFKGGPFVPNAQKGWVTLSTWEYAPGFSGVDDPYILQPLKAIIDGQHDDYLRAFAQDAESFDKPLFLRWGHEMNGDWYLWSGSSNGGAVTDQYGDLQKPDGPELFVDAYRHIHNVFSQENSQNVIWVWCPNVVMKGPLGETWNDIENYYPGDAYVDWLCMDGYNWGTSQSWSSWQTFDEVFAPTYARLQQINPNKPVMIGEFASTDQGGDKAAWVLDAFQTALSDYPQIRAAVWFNLNKETDWRMNSSLEVLDAFQQALALPGWVQTYPGFGK